MMTGHAIKYLFATFRERFGDRVFPDFAPKGTGNPSMVYQVIGDDFEPVMEASRGDDELFVELRIYTDGITGGRAEANRLRDEIRDELEALSPGDLAEGVRLDGSYVDSYSDSYEHETNEYGAICIWHPTIVRRDAAFS